MRAHVINGKELAFFLKNGDHPAVYGERLPLALGNVSSFSDSNEFSHTILEV
jgi:hypothetical protein